MARKGGTRLARGKIRVGQEDTRKRRGSNAHIGGWTGEKAWEHEGGARRRHGGRRGSTQHSSMRAVAPRRPKTKITERKPVGRYARLGARMIAEIAVRLAPKGPASEAAQDCAERIGQWGRLGLSAGT